MKDVEAALSVKFKSTLQPGKLEKACRENLLHFRDIPGLVAKYDLSEEESDWLAGIYVFSTTSAREAFKASSLAKELGLRFGMIPETTRVERYHIDFIDVIAR
jgi:hypothetical protein